MQEDPTHKCKGCNNVKGCITCVDGSEYAHIEECNITGIKSKKATGKLKELVDNVTEKGLAEAREQLQELVNGGLDEEINRYIEQHSSELPGYFDLRRIARHFFVFGLNKSMQKESQLDSPDFKAALEKKIREAQDWTYIEEEGGSCPLNEEFGAADLEEFAEWGASWMRDQMMKDAVDFTFTRCCSAQLDMDLHAKGLDYGDEVKLVIIKKE